MKDVVANILVDIFIITATPMVLMAAKLLEISSGSKYQIHEYSPERENEQC